jgi:hypothetical protein
MQACYHHSIGCHGPYSGPVVEAGFQIYACPYPGAYGYDYAAAGQPPPMPAGPYGQPPPMQAGPYGQPPPMQAGPYGQPPPMQAGPYGQPPPMPAGPYGPAHQWAPQAMMPEMLRPGIPPYCQSPTNLCPGFHSHYVPCAWSCPASVFFDQAMPGGVDPAAQLGALKEQLLAQLAAVQGQQPGVGQGMAPTTIAETDRLIQELETTVHQLRAHRAALERLAGG